MSTPKHTRGPWTIVEHIDSVAIKNVTKVLGTTRQVEETVFYIQEGLIPNMANLKLISAAPEMLAALKGIFQAQAPNFNFDFSKHPYMQAMVDAIAKAEGKS